MAPRKKATGHPPSDKSPSGGLGLAQRGGQGKIFTSPSINVEFAGPGHRVNQLNLELDGVYHGEASYEGRIFFDNPEATLDTPRTLESGYAGSFHIFGHGGCLGDPGHCEVRDLREKYDFRSGHPLIPRKVRVNVTKALLEIARSKKSVTVTIVPVITAANELCDKENVLRFEGMQLIGYNP